MRRPVLPLVEFARVARRLAHSWFCVPCVWRKPDLHRMADFSLRKKTHVAQNWVVRNPSPRAWQGGLV